MKFERFDGYRLAGKRLFCEKLASVLFKGGTFDGKGIGDNLGAKLPNVFVEEVLADVLIVDES